MKKFALNPPCPRAPLAPGQIADPTSLKRGEDYATEWARRQAKLAKQAKEAVRKFNEDSTAASTTKASASKPKKAMPKKPAHKPKASAPISSPPSSSAMPSRPAPQSPHGKFLTLLLLHQSPQQLLQSPQLLCIWLHVKGLLVSRLPLVFQQVPQLHQFPHQAPHC